MKSARLFLVAVALFFATTVSFGQQSFMDEPGIPAFTTSFPVEHGFINLANGNLHLEIPIAAYAQRGNIKALHARLVYDSRFWTISTNNNEIQTWTPSLPLIGVNVGGMFRLVTDGEGGRWGNDHGVVTQCALVNGQPRFKTTYSNYFYQDPSSTRHSPWWKFEMVNNDPACSGAHPSGDANVYAADNSGYLLVIKNYSVASVLAPDGTQVYPNVQDTNGNTYNTVRGQDLFTNNVVDTLGRTPVIATSSGNQWFLDYLCTQGCNSANDRARVTVTSTSSPAWATHFNETNSSGAVGEWSGPGSNLQSISLPDGTSYQFQYDSYGQITSMTLPAGGQITYGYTNFTDQAGNVNRWVTSMVRDGQTWTFTPTNLTCSSGICPLQVTVTTPAYNDGSITASDNHVYLFSIIDQGISSGSWNTQIQYFRGAVSGSPVLTKNIDYGGAGACPAFAGLTGFIPVPIRETLTWPSGSGTLSKKAEYCYDNYANVTATKEWDYQPNGNFAAAPDREIDNVYHTDPTADANFINANLIRLIKTSTTLGAGTQVAQSSFGYDETAFQPSTISTHHVTPAASLGNQTSVTRWLNTGGSVTSTTKWFDTGEVYQSKDPLLHTTTLSYDSAFSGAYLTQTCNALTPTQCSYNGYDFNTGLRTSSTDVNGTGPGDAAHTTTYSYDTLLRPLCTNLADGGQTCLSYPDANHVSRTQIITSGLSDLSSTILDGLGRTIHTQHTLPAGVSTVDTHYDPVGIPDTVSNPYFTTSDPTYGITQSFHDALGRTVKNIKQDGSISTAAYSVGNATTANGTCVTGTDEAGSPRMACHNGFGELVEVDEPGGPDPGTQAATSVNVSGAFNSTWVGAGTPHLAATGSALASVAMSDPSSHTFYFDTNQHLCQISWNSSGWFDQDLTSMTEAGLPLAGSSIAAVNLGGVLHVFYQGANLHIYDMNWTGSVWQNIDMTALTGASAMSGTKMSAVLTGNPNSPMMFYEGTNQHLFTVYWNSSANAWQNADLNALSGATTLMAVRASFGSAMFVVNGGVYLFYIGTNQHLIDINWDGSSRWLTGDLTIASGGAALAVSGSAVTTIASGTSIDLMSFYEGANQHIYSVYWNGGAGAWQTLDFTSWSGATNIAAALTSLANNPVGPHMFYFSSSQHLDDMLWNGSAWVNADLTSLANTTMVPASGSSLSSHGTVAGGTYHIFFEGGNQHIYHTYYNPSASGWFNDDPLVAASNFVVDSGTVSLSIPNGTSNFVATVCYGVSTNPICAGQPVNASPGDIANALAAVLNGAGSPVNATVTQAALNLTWRSVGAVTTTVAAMTSTSDNPALFPNGSFTSTSGTFSGGIAPSNQSLRNPFVTQYQYDALGNLLRVDQKGTAPSDSTQWRTRTFTYDSLSRLLTANNPESGTITYSYDADSELLQKTSPAPNQNPVPPTQTVSYCYDAVHRVTFRDYSPHTYNPPACPITAPVVSYFYDSGTNGKGHLTSLADQAGSGIYGYDNMGRMTTETRVLTGPNNGAISKSAGYEYNLDGSLYKLHYPSGNAVTYAPGAASLTLSAIDSGSGINYVTSATYGPDSALSGFLSGNSPTFAGVTNKFLYTPRLQPCRMIAATSGTLPVLCGDTAHGNLLDLGYDFHLGNGTSGSGADNGNVFGITNNKDTTRSQTFTYDALNRLTSAQNSGTDCSVFVLQGKTKFWGNSYAYDAWGNLLQKNITKCSAEHLLATADAQNRIHVPTPDYVYDAAGNMTTDVTDGVTAFYDQENRVSTATSGGITTTYSYDSDGNRVIKSNGSTGTLYWYMAPGVVAETDLAGTTQSEYIFFDGERVARRDGATGTGGVFYYFSDHLKTASVITDSVGVIKAESDYYPWGGELPFVNNDSNHYKFTGKERDGESGLDYFGARYYSNGLGRWISADWSATAVPVPYADLGDPQSLNLYGYVRDLPTSRADGDGHGIIDRVLCALGSSAACKNLVPAPPSPPPAPPTPAVITPGTPQNNLANAQDAARANPNNQPVGTPGSPDRKTFCNIATCQIVKATATTTDGLVNAHGQPNLANTDAHTLANSPSWHQVTPQEAQNLANQGVTVVGVISEAGHGHIATVRPELLPGTQDVAAHGPLVNNIGGHVGVTNGNNAFGGATPTYYAPTNNQNH
jgi:RHS repeat-associated protein